MRTPGRPRVLLVCNALGMGGTERNVVVLAREFARLGVDVRVHPLVGGGVLTAACAAWLAHGEHGGADARAAEARLHHHMRSWKPDVVHVLGTPADAVTAGLCARPGSPRLVISVQDRLLYRGAGVERLMRWALQGADLVVTDGAGTRQDVIDRLGVAPERVRSLIDGVDRDALRSTRARVETRAQLGTGDEHLLIGCVARLDLPKKGQDVLLAAAARLAHPQMRLALVGEGDALTVLQQSAQRLGIAGTVCFAGTRTDLGDVIGAFDIGVVPSRWESVPKALLEMMALARATIATSAGDMGEVLRHDVNALVVPPGDEAALAAALRRLADSAALRSRLGVGARATVLAGFTAAGSAAVLAGWYEEVLSGPPCERGGAGGFLAAPFALRAARRHAARAHPYMVRSVSR